VRSQVVVAALLTVGLSGPVIATPAGSAGIIAEAVPATATVLGAPTQEDGLETRTKATYVVDPAAGAVRVTIETTVTNQIPNRSSGGVIEQAYFSEIGVPILAEAANFVATKGDGGTATVTPTDIGNPYVKSALVDLTPNLFYGQSQTIKLTYDLPNQPPRAAGVSRANDAFVAFPAFTFGDPGLTSIEVRVPERFAVEVVGATLDETTREGHTILTAENIEEPDGFTAFVVGTDDDKLVSKQADVDGAEVEVRAWPDDAEWADFAAEQVADAKPVLEELIGQPWPRDDELVIVETAGPYAYGYAGWYSEADHEISVGDDLDPRVMVHELSHVWFNSQLFADRWVAEGFAEEYSSRALEELGERQEEAATPDRSGDGAIALNDWSDPFLLDETSEATEQYGYAASWYVIDLIAQEIGVDELRDVLAAVADHEISYAGDPTGETLSGAADWRRMLDLLEERAGSETAAELWDAYVVNDAQQADMALRETARADYQELAERGDTWTPPLEVRTTMSKWEFDGLEDSIGEADAVLDVREDIDAALAGHEVDGLALEDAYESAEATEDVLPVAEDTLDAATAYARADASLDEGAGPLGAVGLLWSGTEDKLDTARRELEGGDPAASLRASRAVEGRLDNATRDGALRAGGAAAVLGLGLFGVLRLRGWRRGRRRRRAERSADATFAKLAPSAVDGSGSGERPADRPADGSFAKLGPLAPVERPSNRPSERRTLRSSDLSSDRTAASPADRTAGRPDDRSTERSGDRSTDEPAGRSGDRSTDEPAERPAGRAGAPSAAPSADRPGQRRRFAKLGPLSRSGGPAAGPSEPPADKPGERRFAKLGPLSDVERPTESREGRSSRKPAEAPTGRQGRRAAKRAAKRSTEPRTEVDESTAPGPEEKKEN